MMLFIKGAFHYEIHFSTTLLGSHKHQNQLLITNNV